MIEKIVSGGQTGVDRAALDAAIDSDLPLGGWCPKGRIDEQGLIPQKYDQLIEVSGNFGSDKENYDARTKLNIRDSDGTLILVPMIPIPSQIKDGTLLTINEVSTQKKPHLLLNLSSSEADNISMCIEWIKTNDLQILNIAGPRESNCEGIYKASYSFFRSLLPELISSQTLRMY